MILTPLKIQVAIIKAWYSIALKSVKYYAGLAVGINNSCLLKQARLLRKYVEILRNFTIVGSTIECSCCIEGDYTVLLNDLSEVTEANIQFGCDTEGYMLFNGVGYPFTYYYDEPNSKVFLKFTTLIDPSTELPYELNLEDVTFSNTCDFTTSTLSPIEEATIEPITNPPVTYDYWEDWDGNISIYEPNGTTLLVPPILSQNPLTIPVNIIDDPEAIVDYWNANGIPGWLLVYSNNQFTMLTPFDQVDYSGYIIKFSQYEGGIDSRIINATFIPQELVPFGLSAVGEIDIPETFVASAPATTTITPKIPQAFVTENTPATVTVRIPTTSFNSILEPATLTIEVNFTAMFDNGSTTQGFFWDGSFMFSHTGGTYATAQDLVDDFNLNNGNGFTMSYVGIAPTGNYLFDIVTPPSGAIYNGTQITITYYNPVFEDDGATFSGGLSAKPFVVDVNDGFGLTYLVTNPTFNSVQDFVDDFNANNPLGYVAQISSATSITTNVKFTAPPSTGWSYNGTAINYSTIGPGYSFSDNYAGGIDTTEGFYVLALYNPLNVLQTPTIQNLTVTNYASLQEIADDININPNNVGTRNFTATVVNSEIVLTTDPLDLLGATYNNYYVVLQYVYNSAQYPLSYTSNQSTFLGGVNRLAEKFDISDTVNSTIFSKLANTYNYANVNDLVNDFNSNILAYYAENAGPGTTIPEVKSTADNIFTTSLLASNGDRITARLNLTTVIGTYNVPTTGPVIPNLIVSFLRQSIIFGSYPGSVSFLPIIGGSPASNTGLRLTAPTGAGDSYNGNTFSIFREDFVLATATFIFTAPSPGNTSFKITANGVNLGTYTVLGLSPETPTQLATGYAALVNSGTGTHGFTASTNGATLLTITAPPYTGVTYNTLPCILTVIQGSVEVLNPNQNFIGGQTNSTFINSATFSGGEDAVLTTKVRFYTPPQPLTAPEYGTGNWAFNGETITYNYNTGEYDIDDNYSGGVDPTVGRLTVEILNPDLSSYAILYTDADPQNYLSRQSLVNIFNAANPLPENFQIVYSSNPNRNSFLSPTDSFSFFNNFIFRYSYNYVSDQSTGGQYISLVDEDRSFVNTGIDPTLTPYEGEFLIGNIGTFVNDDPCEATIAEQDCLSNKQVSDIIKHINKLVR
jgi:hypothetical protein